jgi:hypothetical protein
MVNLLTYHEIGRMALIASVVLIGNVAAFGLCWFIFRDSFIELRKAIEFNRHRSGDDSTGVHPRDVPDSDNKPDSVAGWVPEIINPLQDAGEGAGKDTEPTAFLKRMKELE